MLQVFIGALCVTLASFFLPCCAASQYHSMSMTEANPPRLPRDQSKKVEIEKGSRYLILKDIVWPPGYTINVAFNGGSPEVYKEIAETAAEWSKYGNIKFDFGYDPATGAYRQWQSSDRQYKADVRIAFDLPGHWSLLGRESVDPNIRAPGDRSMNLNLDIRKYDEDGWRQTVLHEFGHVLGFDHEHKHPGASYETELRWENDKDYMPTKIAGQYVVDKNGRRPGLYTWFSGQPNNWSKEMVDSQVRPQLQPGQYSVSAAPDRYSIMQYCLDQSFYAAGKASPCYCDWKGRGPVLSESDKEGVAVNYPRQQQ